LDLWKQWTTNSNKHGLKEALDYPKGKRKWKEQQIRKLKTAVLSKAITESLNWIGPEGQALWDDNLEFYRG